MRGAGKTMYNKVDTNLNFVDREKNVEKFWKDNDIFRKSMDSRKEGETYTFMMDRRRQTASRTSAMC